MSATTACRCTHEKSLSREKQKEKQQKAEREKKGRQLVTQFFKERY